MRLFSNGEKLRSGIKIEEGVVPQNE